MDIKKMSKEEVEKLSHLDIAYNLLKHEHKTLTTVELLKEVCDVLGYGDNEFEDLIGDFYTSLNLDKRFILICLIPVVLHGIWCRNNGRFR